MDLSEKEETVSQTLDHLWKIGHKLSTTCPAASRYYMFNLKRYLSHNPTLQIKGTKSKSKKFCNYCGSLWSPENFRVKIQPPPSKNNHIKKLLKWDALQPWKLNNCQRKKLLKFKESTSKIVYYCFICKKSMKYPGFKRKMQSSTIRNSLYTLPSNIKPNKVDLNAGLFIATPSPIQKRNKIIENTQENNHSFSDIKCLDVTTKNLSSENDSDLTQELLSRSLPISSNDVRSSVKNKYKTPPIVSVSEKTTSAKKKKERFISTDFNARTGRSEEKNKFIFFSCFILKMN